jgi:hypothetical protein
MHAYEAIQTIETDLRTLVRLILGENWLAISGLDSAVLEGRRQTEGQRRPAAALDQDLLAYTELTQLQNLILDKAWDQFAPALGTRAHIKTYLSKISAYRNPTMHSRPLLPFEEHLVLGISGELRNQIALYRKEREEANMFWPTIEQVTDSFGHTAVGPAGDAGTSGVRLEVGNVVTFKCRAYDPEQRELTWRLNARGIDLDTGVGGEVTLTWTVTTADVGESMLIHVLVKSTGPYHRISQDWGDDYVYFHYPVNPPR